MIFSIIVPIYNVEKYLRCCVDSVLAENFADYEMILVDDGSPDGCGKICDEYAGKYPHIKVIHQENGGLSDARNAGIRAAKGDYLIFLDSDDYWADTNRSKNAGGGDILFDLQQLADKKVDLILHPSSLNYHVIPKGADFSDNDFVRHFETLVEGRYYIANAWTKIVRREIIIKNNLFFPRCADASRPGCGFFSRKQKFPHLRRFAKICLRQYRLSEVYIGKALFFQKHYPHLPEIFFI